MTHFFVAVRFGPALHSCLMLIHIAKCQCPSCPSLLFPTLCSTFALPAFDLSLCPALSCPVLPCPVLSCPACKLSNFWPKRPSGFATDIYIDIYIQGRRFCSQLCLILNCLSFPKNKSYNNFRPQVFEIIVCSIVLFNKKNYSTSPSPLDDVMKISFFYTQLSTN